MTDKESHSVRNGIIATVVGGVILTLILAIFHKFTEKVLNWIWWVAAWIWETLIAKYSISGWLLLVIAFFASLGIVRIYIALRPQKEEAFKKYTEDIFYGVKWRWSWAGNRISNLGCFCPRCDAQLVYDDSSCRHIMNICKTDFICEHCENQIVATITGGDKLYAFGAGEREILRRIRTNEHISSNN